MRLFSIIILLIFLNSVRSDEFQLRDGGKVTGTLLNVDEKPRQQYRIRLDAGGEVTLDTKQVTKATILSPEQKKYRELLAKIPSDSVELHWKMAQQCQKWSLFRERKFHLEQVIRLEPEHEQARRALRHKKRKDGTWGSLEEVNQEAGLVRQGGRWVTKQQAQLKASEKEQAEAEIKWKKKLKMWRGWLSDGRRRDRALNEISAIDDTTALGPLIDLFRSESDPALRDVLSGVLVKFNSNEATKTLVEASLFGSRDLQLQCVRQLEKHNRQSAVPMYVRELRNSNNQLVRRAGYALGVLGGEEVVLPLIRALRTTHTRYVGGNDGRMRFQNGTFSAGQAKPKKVDDVKNNKEVRSALTKLTGQDFEYDESRWLRWYMAKSTPPNLDLRRDQ